MTVIVHRYWSGPDPAPLGAWGAQAVRSAHPGARLVDWDDDTLPDTARSDHADPRARSTVARFALLAGHGGLWLDHDVIPVRRLDHGGPWVAGLGGRPEASAMWMPTPRHPLMVAAATAAADEPSAAAVLRSLLADHPDVALERRALAHDAAGTRQPGEAWAVHLWATTRRQET